MLAVVAAIALVGFLSHALDHPRLLVDLRVFINRAYAAATALNLFVGTAMFAGSLCSRYTAARSCVTAR